MLVVPKSVLCTEMTHRLYMSTLYFISKYGGIHYTVYVSES